VDCRALRRCGLDRATAANRRRLLGASSRSDKQGTIESVRTWIRQQIFQSGSS
jgi:hypothetical protein